MTIDTVIIPPGGEFADTVLGAISWSKGMGRPDRPHLADGFSIVIFGTDVADTAPGGPIFHLPVVLTPKVWDGDGGPDNYRVQFSQGALKSVEGLTRQALTLDAASKADINLRSTYKVVIALRPGMTWTSGPPPVITPVRVDPRELQFQKHDGTLELPDFGLSDSLF
jgi:hypothetical protein